MDDAGGRTMMQNVYSPWGEAFRGDFGESLCACFPAAPGPHSAQSVFGGMGTNALVRRI